MYGKNLICKTSCTLQNIIHRAKRIPSVCMGMTWSPNQNNAGTLDHTLAEWFPVEGAYKGVQALLLMPLGQAGIE